MGQGWGPGSAPQRNEDTMSYPVISADARMTEPTETYVDHIVLAAGAA